MQRWYRIAGLFMSIALLCFAFGCSDDDDSPTGTNNTTPLEVQYEIFSSEFGGASEMSGMMVGLILEHIDLINTPMSPGKQLPSRAATGLEYHQTSKFWVVYDTIIDGDMLSTVDSIQFIEGTDTVQYPNFNNLTKVRSYMTMDMDSPEYVRASATTGNLATFHQNLDITTTATPSDTLFISGTGSVLGAVMDTMQNQTDSIVCDINLQASWTINSFAIDTKDYVGGIPCAYAGSIVYDVNADISCSGTDSGSTVGNWDVILTFDEGLMAWTYTFGSRSWYDTTNCMQ